jgi:hypothetical protein
MNSSLIREKESMNEFLNKTLPFPSPRVREN